MCEEKHAKEFGIENYWGKACFRYCVKYKFLHSAKTKNCKEFKLDVYDLSKRETHDIFTSAGYTLKK